MKSMSEISWLIYVPGTAFIDLCFPTAFQVTLCFLSFMEEVFTFIMTLRYSSILKMSFIVCKTFLKLFFPCRTFCYKWDRYIAFLVGVQMLTWDIFSLFSQLKSLLLTFQAFVSFLLLFLSFFNFFIISFLYFPLKKDTQIHFIKFCFLVEMIGKSN